MDELIYGDRIHLPMNESSLLSSPIYKMQWIGQPTFCFVAKQNSYQQIPKVSPVIDKLGLSTKALKS